MPATCTGLGGAQKKPICEPRIAALVLGLGPLSKISGVCRGKMLFIGEILGKAKAGGKRDQFMEKQLGICLCGPASWVTGVLGNHQGRANSGSQVDGDSDMAPACQLKEAQ